MTQQSHYCMCCFVLIFPWVDTCFPIFLYIVLEYIGAKDLGVK